MAKNMREGEAGGKTDNGHTKAKKKSAEGGIRSTLHCVATRCDARLSEHRDSVFPQVVATYTFEGLFLVSPLQPPTLTPYFCRHLGLRFSIPSKPFLRRPMSCFFSHAYERQVP